jgi:hypothetical protein
LGTSHEISKTALPVDPFDQVSMASALVDLKGRYCNTKRSDYIFMVIYKRSVSIGFGSRSDELECMSQEAYL